MYEGFFVISTLANDDMLHLIFPGIANHCSDSGALWRVAHHAVCLVFLIILQYERNYLLCN